MNECHAWPGHLEAEVVERPKMRSALGAELVKRLS